VSTALKNPGILPTTHCPCLSSSRRRYCCCWRPARSRDQRRRPAELAAGVPARSGERRDPRARVEVSFIAELLAGFSTIHVVHVPAAEVLVEFLGVHEPGERSSDARSERERERVWAGERTAGEVSTHMDCMSVTELVSQLLRGWLKASAFQNLATERATRGASVSVSASGRASARRARSVPTWHTCSSPNSCPSY